MPSVPSVPLNEANRFAHIDAMRAFAVLIVVVAHAGYGYIVPGGSGVTIFFAISGFIITHLLLRERDKTGSFSAGGFYFRRIVKIAPPLILVVVVPTLIYSIWVAIDWAAFLAEVFFIFNWWYVDGEPHVLPGTGVVWSLSIEEQFYIVFAIIWLLSVRLKYWRLIMMIVAAFGVVYSTLSRLIIAMDPMMTDRIYYGSDTRLDGIAWGVLAALSFHIFQERKRVSDAVFRYMSKDMTLILAVSLYIISLIIRDEWFRDTFRFTLQSLAACFVIIYGLLPGQGPIRRIFYAVSQWKWVSLTGLASYSIYLVHLVLMEWLREYLILPLPLEALILSCIGVGVGICIYGLVEVPFHRYARKARKNRQLERMAP